MRSRRYFRFFLVGLGAVGFDFLAYNLALNWGLSSHWSKAMGFVLGSLFAFVANGFFTFNEKPRLRLVPIFAAIYSLGLGLNVSANAMGLRMEISGVDRLGFAFFFATCLSMVWNYWGMSRFVFSRSHKTIVRSGVQND